MVKNEKYEEVIRYLIIGVLTTVVSLIVYYGCTLTFLNPKDALHLQIANIISWIIPIIFCSVIRICLYHIINF